MLLSLLRRPCCSSLLVFVSLIFIKLFTHFGPVSLMPVGSVNVSHRLEVGEPSSHSPSAAHSYAGVVRRGSSLGMEDSSAS